MPHVVPADPAALEAVLRADPVRHFSALQILTRWSGAADHHLCGRSAFFRLRDPDDGNGFVVLAASDVDEGRALASLADGRDTGFFTIDAVEGEGAAHGEPAGTLIGSHALRWNNPCVQMSLPDSVVLPEPDPEVVPLDPAFAPFLHEHYTMKHVLDAEYLAERIRQGPSACILRDGRPVGWSMTHDEGTMGVLEVLPEYRRQGIAEKVSWTLCRWVRDAGMVPTVHIKRGNAASFALAAKMGFVRTAAVTWFGWAER